MRKKTAGTKFKKKGQASIKRFQAFTLIELLVVIAVLAILLGITIVGIDPIDKINASNDVKVQRDINVLATAMEGYAVNHGGGYAGGSADEIQSLLIGSGDLKARLVSPFGYNEYEIEVDAGPPEVAKISGELKSKKYISTGSDSWVWCSSCGRADATDGLCPDETTVITATPTSGRPYAAP